MTSFHVNEQRLLDCVHCGFCLSACPTFNVLGNEMDSPRGRIYLMRLLSEGRLDPTSEVLTHFDLCLGCLACEPACPAGVQYRHLIEETRAQVRAIASPDYFERMQQQIIDMVFPHPAAMAALLIPLRVARRLGIRPKNHRQSAGWLRKLLGPMDLISDLPPLFQKPLPQTTAALGERKYRVGLISGCVMNVLFRDTNRATLRVLSRAGCEVVTPPQQCCCGALLVHGGNPDEARKFARKNIDVFESLDLDAIIINAAGCGATLKEYQELLRDEPEYRSRAASFASKVRDISEWCAEIGYRPTGDASRLVERFKPSNRSSIRLTYHDPCHLCHGQGIRDQPRSLLRSIDGIDWVELKESDMCCGSAGTYNLTQPEMADTLLRRKIGNLRETNADIIATGNPGCLMQIQMGLRHAGLQQRVVHPVEILDALENQ